MIRIGIVATSSVVPKVEFEIGVTFLRSKGYSVDVHPKVLGEFMFYPAPDAERAEALIETALRKDLDALWCARGGYGATHLLPHLNRAKNKLKRAPKKTLLGYSDATALLEWFRVNLGWKTIHAPSHGIGQKPVGADAEILLACGKGFRLFRQGQRCCG